MTEFDRPDRSPAVAELLDDAYVAPAGLDTASRHLWAIHSEAGRLAGERSVVAGRELVGAGSGAGRRTVPRAAVPLLVVVMMMSSSGMALAASQSSLPGDVLYSVKRGTERAQLVFARSPEARAQLQLSFARTRLDEIRQIAVTRPQHVPALVAAINVTLTEVDLSAPEAAPVSDRIRQEVAQLELQAATAPADVAVSTPVPTVATAPTATAVPTTTTPEVEPVPSEESTPGTPSESPSEDPSPEPSESSTEDVGVITIVPTSTASEGDPGTILSDPETGTTGGTPTPTPTPTPTSSASPSPSASPSDGPIVTPRPHGEDGEGGESRSDDGTDDAGDDLGPDEPSDDPSGPITPYVRSDGD